jgi:hypothetical protein
MPAYEGRWFTVADLVNRWRCGNKAVLAAIHEERLVAHRVGHAYRVELAEVERYERDHQPPRRTREATPEQQAIPRGVSARHQAAIPTGAQTSGLRASCRGHGFDPGELGFLPDAFTIDATAKTITLYEVVVTHGLGAGKLKKLAAFCDLVEALGWRVGLLIASVDGRYTEHDPRTGRLTDRAWEEMAEQVGRALR